MKTLEFEQSEEDYAEFTMPMPTKWGEGEITIEVLWIPCKPEPSL